MGGSGQSNVGLGMARHGNQGEPGRKGMEKALEQRLREVLGDLPPEDVYAVIAFVQFLSEHSQGERATGSQAELSEAEHARMLHVLDAVVALSSATGPAVSNRDHDRYLYGKD